MAAENKLRSRFERLVHLPHSEDAARWYVHDTLGARAQMDIHGNIVAGAGRVAVLCHLDTVFDARTNGEIIHNPVTDEYHRVAGGVGGDDRCGVTLALELLLSGAPVRAFFFSREETGGVGSRLVDLQYFEGVQAVIGLDWLEGCNIVVSDPSPLCSSKFRRLVRSQAVPRGYRLSELGMFSDATNIRRRTGLNCAVVPVGYYGWHSRKEYVSFKDLMRAAELVECLVEKIGQNATLS